MRRIAKCANGYVAVGDIVVVNPEEADGGTLEGLAGPFRVYKIDKEGWLCLCDIPTGEKTDGWRQSVIKDEFLTIAYKSKHGKKTTR